MNLIASLMNDFTGETLTRVASTFGETPAKTATALESVVPAIVGGLANTASTTLGASGLFEMFRRNRFDSNPPDITSALASPASLANLTSAGRTMLESVLGARTNAITNWISSSAGIPRSSVMSLLTFTLPLVMGQISRYFGSGGLTPSSLQNLLTGQKAFLNEMPAGLAAAMGMGMGDQPRRPTAGTYDSEPTHRSPVVETYTTEVGESSWWKWALPALLLALIPLYYAMRTPTPQLAFEAPTVTVPAIPSIPIETATTQLPIVGTTGTFATAITELQGFSKSLEFQTNSARLTRTSREQLRHAADVLTKNPTLNIKIAGYTDNVGDDARNIKLSTDRATNAMKALVKFGVDASRIEAVGYGEINPIADNATAEGRQSNRRIDISVTKQ